MRRYLVTEIGPGWIIVSVRRVTPSMVEMFLLYGVWSEAKLCDEVVA